MSDTLVITPTYNEKENIEAIIRKVFSLPKEFDMLIIEDNSPDGTADIVKRRKCGSAPSSHSKGCRCAAFRQCRGRRPARIQLDSRS